MGMEGLAETTTRAEKEQSIAAGILSFLLLLCAFGDTVCGVVWVSYGGPDGHGLWSGFGLFLAAALGILQWRTNSRTVMILFLLMSMVSLIICLAQAAFTGLSYRIWRVLTVDPLVECGVVESLCRCTKPGETIDMPFRLSSCDRIKSLTGIVFAMTFISAFGALLSFAGMIIGILAHGQCIWNYKNDDMAAGRTIVPGTVMVTNPAANQGQYADTQY